MTRWSISSVPSTRRIWPIFWISVYIWWYVTGISLFQLIIYSHQGVSRSFVYAVAHKLHTKSQIVITALANWKKVRLITIEVIKKHFSNQHFYVVQAKWRIWKEFKWFLHGELRYVNSSFLYIHLLILLVLFIWRWQFFIGVMTVGFIHVFVKNVIRDLFGVYFWLSNFKKNKK